MNNLILGATTGVMLMPLGAETVTWRAVGEVNGVVTQGGEGFAPLGVATGQKVEVEFGYDDAAGGIGIRDFSAFGWFVEWGYHSGIDLQIRVRIADHEWTGVIGTAGPGSPDTVVVKDVLGDIGENESLSLTVSDAEPGVFSSFPGQASSGGSALSVSLLDQVHPYDFLESRRLPDATDLFLGGITSASGIIRSGAESISFTIDPRSIVVANGPAGVAVVASISMANGEVTLAWTAEVGADYTIRGSENLRQWDVLEVRTADVVDERATFSPPVGPAARFYQVSRDE